MISGAPEQLYAVCDMYVRHNNAKTEACLGELGKVAPPYVIEQLKAKQNL
ncbi:TPR repeat protein [Vibrio maritimus]|uniref:TPR repeat protein n=1 Tax=Vibrio maritimus TaxID=990268 RepID=A0A090SWN1_9VIBR|nr:TPR repeat protein [Vibrio maritimus]